MRALLVIIRVAAGLFALKLLHAGSQTKTAQGAWLIIIAIAVLAVVLVKPIKPSNNADD